MNYSGFRVFPLLFVGLCIWLASAFFSDGYYQADEHYQIIEFANYKLGKLTADQLPWEFAEQMRPGLQPLLAFSLIRTCSAAGIVSPFIQVMLLRMITALLAFFAGWALINSLKTAYPKPVQGFLLWAMLLFLWFMPLLAVRFSSENLSGIFMVFAVSLLLSGKQPPSRYLVAGLLAGLAFLFRYQSAVMIGGLLLWLLIIQKPGNRRILAFLAGALLISACGFLTDRWLYGEWVCAPWNYFSNNLLQDKLTSFGVKPWHHYFTSGAEQMLLPLGLLVWISAFTFWITKSRSPITWITLPFVLFHVLLAHKEVRFLFPLFYFIPVFILQLAMMLSRLRFFQLRRIRVVLITLFFLINLPVLFLSLDKPADEYVGALHAVHASGSGPSLLYYTDNDPLSPFGLPLYFYQTHDIRTVRVTRAYPLQALSVPSDTTVFLFEEMKGIHYREDPSAQRLFCKYPSFLKAVDFGHWQDRTSNWALYRLKREE